MFNSIVDFFKARWKWGRGICPSCDKKFHGHNQQRSNCSICSGEWDDLTIWTNWRHRKPSLYKAVEATAHPEIDRY